MRFLPIPDNEPKLSRSGDLGLLALRLVTVATSFYYQLSTELRRANDHLWNDSDWPLVAQLLEWGLAAPVALTAAIGALVLTATSTLGLLLGFFTRANAFVFAALTVVVLLSGIALSPTLKPQSLVLYLAISACLVCAGGGRISLDHLLKGRSARRDKT